MSPEDLAGRPSASTLNVVGSPLTTGAERRVAEADNVGAETIEESPEQMNTFGGPHSRRSSGPVDDPSELLNAGAARPGAHRPCQPERNSVERGKKGSDVVKAWLVTETDDPAWEEGKPLPSPARRGDGH